MQLCIDWGNTRVKAGFFQDDQLTNDYNFSEEEALAQIMQLIEEYCPQSAILCSVAHYPPELKVLLQEKTQLLILNSQTSLPVLSAYQSPETLGMDRIALAVGAYKLYPGCNSLVISLGTAITYNFMHKNNIFRGGSISPGMQMRFKALHEYTDKLPLVTERGDLVLLGYDTETSIRSGVLWGIAAEIDGIINNYLEQYPDLRAVITGGDAGIFANKLKSRIFADPQLLLKGLNTILLHNVR